MREQATRTGRRSRKGIACAAVLACVLGAGCLGLGLHSGCRAERWGRQGGRFHDNNRAGTGDK